MGATEIIAIAQLVSALTPPAITLVNNIVSAFESLPAEERSKALQELKASLKPMAEKP